MDSEWQNLELSKIQEFIFFYKGTCSHAATNDQTRIILDHQCS